MDRLSHARREILAMLKREGASTTSEIADGLSVSYEAVRQQLLQLENDGLVDRAVRREGSGTKGRPAAQFVLTEEGENTFPKAYDELMVEMIDSVAERLGSDALRTVLESFTERRVRAWESKLEGLTLEEKLDELQGLYLEGDPYMEWVRDDGELYLIERNCPFLNVATRRPALCSVTVSTLQRLLGYRIERVKRFQDGDGFCAFRIQTEHPLDAPPDFAYEERSNADGADGG